MSIYDKQHNLKVYKSYMDTIGVCETRKEPTKDNIRWFLTDGHKKYQKIDGFLTLFYSAMSIYKDTEKTCNCCSD